MSLCLIGCLPELPDARIGAACKVADGIAAKPFEIILDRARTYPYGRRKLPLIAFARDGVPKAALFRQILIKDLRRAGFIFRGKPPDPHMTLFYDRSIVPEESIDPIRWTVRDFVLVHSILGQGRHVLLEQWPLHD